MQRQWVTLGEWWYPRLRAANTKLFLKSFGGLFTQGTDIYQTWNQIIYLYKIVISPFDNLIDSMVYPHFAECLL